MQNKFLLPALIFLCYLTACADKTNNNASNSSSNPKVSMAAPPLMNSSKTIPENIATDTSHTSLAEAFISTGLMETLCQPGPFTVFAPTNDAFRRLPPGTFEGLMNNRKNDLANILSYHIVAGSIKTKDMKDGEKLETLAGEELIVTLRKDRVLINGINVINPDIETGNGVLYVIDGVLFPRSQNAAAY